ncbi:hypothetical protein [Erythrobacter tepidarius]|uniref:hypothetical protein n=1 Tax=Erythrobacter tepidarius TaxID=60454 RepID=UPI000A37E10A|nr:hypothetical protein [Erythrobacter tepidarius]
MILPTLLPADRTRQFRKLFAACAALLLALPLVAMAFTADVSWGAGDFLGAAILFALLGAGIDIALRLPASWRVRGALAAAIAVVFLLTWAELAVGLLA